MHDKVYLLVISIDICLMKLNLEWVPSAYTSNNDIQSRKQAKKTIRNIVPLVKTKDFAKVTKK